VDVGAAAGLYTQTLSQLVGPAGTVHSIEPVAFSHPVWTRVLGAWERPNVTRHVLALGAETGRIAMRVPYGPHGAATSRSFLDWHTEGVGSNAEYLYHVDMLVDTRTLDGFWADVDSDRLDFLKIDVEGGELHVLQGGEKTIAKFRPMMLVEIEARHIDRYSYVPEDLVGWLTERGYLMYSWRDGWEPVSQVCLHANNYLFRHVDSDREIPLR
jgi:FkbM family methyltransferase